MNVILPRTLKDVFAALEKPGARLLAGGTDLLVRLRPGLDGRAREEAGSLVGLERVEALRGVREEGGVGVGRILRIGAMTTHAELLEHALVRARLPVLAQALADLGSPPIRNMGTIGGNLCTASPAGDTLPPLMVLGAEVELAGLGRARRMPVSEFLRGPGKTALAPGEVLVAVHVPIPCAGHVQHFEKVGRRDALAVAVVSLAASVRIGRGGLVARADLAWGSVAPGIWRCPRAEAALTGRRLTLTSLREAGAIVREEVRPISDIRASADYRREVAGNLLLRLALLG